MKLNFSFKKAYNDLFSNKKYIWQLLSFTLIYFILNVLEIILKCKDSSGFGYTILFGYLCLMANNIIQEKEPVLANIFNKKWNIFWIGWKNGIVEIIYCAALMIPGYLIVISLKHYYGIKILFGIILLCITFLPLIIFIWVSSFILFSENLSITESFNLIKSFKSFKYVWKEYLFSSSLYVICFTLMYVIYAIFHIFFKNFYFDQTANLVMYSFLVISNYFCLHFIAQSYKYSLSKINPQESELQNA